jgi:hypothetical protein
LINGSFFSGDEQDILKDEVKTYQMEQSSPLTSPKKNESSALQ